MLRKISIEPSLNTVCHTISITLSSHCKSLVAMSSCKGTWYPRPGYAQNSFQSFLQHPAKIGQVTSKCKLGQDLHYQIVSQQIWNAGKLGYLVDQHLPASGFSLAHFAQKPIKYPSHPFRPSPPFEKHPCSKPILGEVSAVIVWHKRNRLHLSAEPPLANLSSLRPIYCLDPKQESAIK